MKKYLFTFALFVLSSLSVNAGTKFVELQSNSNQYQVGQSAVLTAFVGILPKNPNYELFLQGFLNDERLKVIRISQTQAASVTMPLTQIGENRWKVQVFLQDKEKSKSLESTIAYYREENLRIEKALETETDLNIRNGLIAERERNWRIIERSYDRLYSGRRYLQESIITFTVNPVTFRTFDNPVIDIRPSKENGVYQTGEKADFFVRSLTDFEGDDGPQEMSAFAWISENPGPNQIQLTQSKIGPRDFLFSTSSFMAEHLGDRLFYAGLKIRSKSKSDSLRSAISEASQMKASYQSDFDKSTDTFERAYLRSLIQELEQLIWDFDRQLEALWVSVSDSRSVRFTVVSP